MSDEPSKEGKAGYLITKGDALNKCERDLLRVLDELFWVAHRDGLFHNIQPSCFQRDADGLLVLVGIQGFAEHALYNAHEFWVHLARGLFRRRIVLLTRLFDIQINAFGYLSVNALR